MFLKYKTFSPKSQKGGTPPTLSGSDWLIKSMISNVKTQQKNRACGGLQGKNIDL